MSTENAPLLSRSETRPRNLSCPPELLMRYRTTCVTTKGGLYVLVALAILNAVGMGPFLYFITTPFAAVHEITIVSGSSFFMAELLMFPAVGLAGEVCCKRFKLLLLGLGLVSTGAVLYGTIFGIWQGIASHTILFTILLYVVFLLVVLGVGIFQANALQYGVDQLDFPSSEVLSSFVYWYYWTSYAFISMLAAISFLGISIYLSIVLCVAGVTLTLLLALTIYFCRRNPQLRSDPGRKPNPLKLIWQVMQFARRKKFPLFRSAFTYSELHSRLDLAKRRYGGPFTTEQVEDIKSFWRILLVLGSLIGYQLQDDTMFTLTEALLLKQQMCSMYLLSPWTVTALTIAIAIPLHQFGVRPYLSRYLPNMLTRMGIGLLVVFLSLIATTMYNVLLSPATMQVYANITLEGVDNGCEINANVSNSSICYAIKNFKIASFLHDNSSCFTQFFVAYDSPLPSFYWLAVPQVLNGLSHMLVFLTTLEFILAQAPRTMQSFLIGLWYAMQIINFAISMVGYTSCAAFHWQYYATKTLLVFLSFILFVVVACKYKYRQLNEDADVNVRQQVEDVFERNMDRKAAYRKGTLLSDQEYTLEGTISYFEH